MARFDEISRRIAADRAMLQRMAQELSYTHQVIKRATLAYHASLLALRKVEPSQINSPLNGPNPLPSAFLAEPSD
jgi:hypothetical protein